MSRIEDLIQQYCPHGVEYMPLDELAEIVRGIRVTKKSLISNGKYPVVSGGTGYMGYLNEYNREANTITIAQYGSAGYVNWQTERFWANDVCYSVIPNEDVILNRYLYFFLVSKQQFLYSISNREAVPYSIQRERILQIKLPVPPLIIQEEIVRILDKFTQLEADLEAELEARRKQYEYYRDVLLDFENMKKRLGGVLVLCLSVPLVMSECVNEFLSDRPLGQEMCRSIRLVLLVKNPMLLLISMCIMS